MKFIKLKILFAALLFLPILSNAQNKQTCNVGSVSFVCPDKLEIENNKKSKDFFVAFDSKYKIYVYAFSPEKEMSDSDLTKKSLEKVFSNIYSTKYKDYKIKDSKDFWGTWTWSQYEVNKFAKAGLNKDQNHILHFQYVQLLLNKKQVVAGFIYERVKGENSEREFDNWRGGGNGSASNDLQKLITSITGEKRPLITPGGPPPPAPVKKQS